MKLFLDTSVLVAASGSAVGASRFFIQTAKAQRWALVTAPYCIEETERNVPKLGPNAIRSWRRILEGELTVVPNGSPSRGAQGKASRTSEWG